MSLYVCQFVQFFIVCHLLLVNIENGPWFRSPCTVWSRSSRSFFLHTRRAIHAAFGLDASQPDEKRVYLPDDDPALPPRQLKERLKKRAQTARKKAN